MKLTKHATQRIIERDDTVSSNLMAQKAAKQAYLYGKVINDYQKFPEFFKYLLKRRNESNSCCIRIYNGNIYIWKGSKRKRLITAHPIPDRFIAEMENV